VTGAVEPLPPRAVYPLPLQRPRATYALLALVLVAFVVETLAGGSQRTDVLVRLGAKVTPLIAAGEYWRLFTSMFLHIGLVHLAFNSYALIVIGTELEQLLGWGRFLLLYLLSGLFGSLASYAFSFNLSAGASGAIFGLIGALAAFLLLHHQRLGTWGRRRLSNVAFLIVVNLFFGFTQPGIDNLAHLGGLLSGLGLGWALAPRYEVDRTRLCLVDRNRAGRYGPALVLALLLLAGSTALATRSHRSHPLSHLLRGRSALDQEAWQEAVAELEEAVAGDPSLAEAHFYLGIARNRLGEHELAATHYEAALGLAPELSEAHWNLALSYLELGLAAQARGHLETYLRLNPGEADQVQPYLDLLEPPP
jgi:rhomboid protease GluP